jgi:hypothetical protein
MKFIKWFNQFEKKRKWMLFFIFLYAIFGLSSTIIPHFYPAQRTLCFIVYGIVSLLFVISSIFVAITDLKEFERNLFKGKN